MKIEYYNNKVEKIMNNMQKTKEKIGAEMTKLVKKRYNEIEATLDFQELMKNNLRTSSSAKRRFKRILWNRINRKL